MKHFPLSIICLNRALTTHFLISVFTILGQAQIQFDNHIIGGGDQSALGVSSVYAIDLDGDKDTDVLSASRHDNKIAWYENDGNANFTPHAITKKADGACFVNAVDLDGDGDIDVLSASQSWEIHAITWYENDGHCNFTAHPISNDFEGARSVYAADLDNDLDIDVIAVYDWNPSRIEWFENNGEENFTKHVITTDLLGLISISISDINKDGFVDIVSVATENSEIMWYKNEGNKSFSPQIIANIYDGGVSIYAIDLNKDGNIDIITSSADNILWHENDGNENFVAHSINDTAYGIKSILSLDMNNDGYIDIVTANTSRNEIVWYENDGNENYYYHKIADSLSFIYSVYASDLDGDSDIDLISASSDSFSDDMLFWYENDGNDNFFLHNIAISLGAVSDLIVKDLDKDGDFDVLGTSLFSYHGIADFYFPPKRGKIFWFENVDKQNYKYNCIDSFEEVANNVNVVDIDGDGFEDIIASFSSYGFYGKLCWYKNNGNQNYYKPMLIDSTYGISSISIADIENDGDFDLFVGLTNSWDPDQSEIVWYKNNGSGEFNRFNITDSIVNVKSVCAIDLDKDGDIDIVSGHLDDNPIIWHENDGNQNFNSHIIMNSSKEALNVTIKDIDSDGDLDIISVSNEDKNISWFENDGKQNFIAHNIVNTVYELSKICVFDLDKDGHLDLIPSPTLDYEYFWFKNDGHNNFLKILQPDLEEVIAAVPIDFDRDGDNDLVVSGWSSLSFYENLDTTITVLKTLELNYLPQKYSLTQNFPNPFNPITKIKYSIPKQSIITLKVFDVLGSEVTTLVNKEHSQGNYELEFNGKDLTSGIYFYRLQVYAPGRAGNIIETKKMILLK